MDSSWVFSWLHEDCMISDTDLCTKFLCHSYVPCYQALAQPSFGENHIFNVTMEEKVLVLQSSLLTELLHNQKWKQCSLPIFWYGLIIYSWLKIITVWPISSPPIAAVFLARFDTQLQSIPFPPSFFNNVKTESGLIKPCCSPPAALAISSFQGYSGNRKGSSGHGNNTIASKQGYKYWPHHHRNREAASSKMNSRLNTIPL